MTDTERIIISVILLSLASIQFYFAYDIHKAQQSIKKRLASLK